MSLLLQDQAEYSPAASESPNRTAIRAGFWRRVAAAWVDGFLIYAGATVLVAMAACIGVRVALEPMILCFGPLYGVLWLRRQGRTPGKMLWGMAVAHADGSPAGGAQLCVREGLGKWLILGWAPALAGRVVFRDYWVPTAYDLLSILPLLCASLLYHVCFRKSWYDHLARTAVLRRPAQGPARKQVFVLLLAMAVLGAAVKTAEWKILGRVPSRTLLYYGMGSTRPYREFLKSAPASASPNDYLFGLFERYDVVVLCERAHSEATQWDFIHELVKDPRFSERIGHVFTELGQTGMQSRLDDLLASGALTESQVDDRVLEIMRNWSVWPVWTRANFPTYLKRLYALNQTLPPGKKIRHHFTDVAEDWASLTKEKMPDHWRALADRDEKMARVIVEEIQRLDAAGGKPAKGLVVVNYRHAFDLTGGSPGASRYNTCEFLRDGLKGRVANVRINEDLLWPVAGGVWNEAFAQTGNPTAGFDLAGSPFGAEPFDLFPWSPAVRGRLKYQDVFTGFVFINPVSTQYFLDGIPGYYRGWETEARRRASLFGEQSKKDIEQAITLERQGGVPVKTPHLEVKIENSVAMASAAGSAVGLVLGLIAFAFRKRISSEVSVLEL